MADTLFLVMLPDAAARTIRTRRGSQCDVTGLLDEWALFLDPVGAMRRSCQTGALDLNGWRSVGVASASATVIRALREAAKDTAVKEALAQSSFRAVVLEDGTLRDQAMSLLLGLAAVTALRVGVGMTAAEIRRTRREERAGEERRSVSGASDERPVISELTDHELASERGSSVRPLLDSVIGVSR